MNDFEAEIYLANAVAASRASGSLTPEEEEFLEDVRLSIKAKKATLKAAVRRSEDHQIDVSQLSRLSDRMRNLEDVIEMVLCDGQLDEAERAVVVSAAKQIGISQEQLNVLVKEAKRRRASRSPTCGSCGKKLAEAAKFCPRCGAEINATGLTKTAKSVDLNIDADGVTIGFAESSSASYGRIMSVARGFPTFHEADRGGKRWFGVSLGFNEITKALELIDLLSGLRNREVYVRGKAHDWRDVFGFVPCAQRRLESYKPVNYCFGVEEGRINPWGCRQLRLDWTNWSDLFGFGKFASRSMFEFDLAQIRHELETRSKAVALCPHLRPKFIAAVLDAFPRKADVKPNGEWNYRRGYDADPRAIKITMKHKQDGFSYTDEFYAIGVEPRDSSALQRLLQSALRRCSQMDIELQNLLPTP